MCVYLTSNGAFYPSTSNTTSVRAGHKTTTQRYYSGTMLCSEQSEWTMQRHAIVLDTTGTSYTFYEEEHIPAVVTHYRITRVDKITHPLGRVWKAFSSTTGTVKPSSDGVYGNIETRFSQSLHFRRVLPPLTLLEPQSRFGDKLHEI